MIASLETLIIVSLIAYIIILAQLILKGTLTRLGHLIHLATFSSFVLLVYLTLFEFTMAGNLGINPYSLRMIPFYTRISYVSDMGSSIVKYIFFLVIVFALQLCVATGYQMLAERSDKVIRNLIIYNVALLLLMIYKMLFDYSYVFDLGDIILLSVASVIGYKLGSWVDKTGVLSLRRVEAE